MTYVPSPPIIREIGELTDDEKVRQTTALNKWLEDMVIAANRVSFRDLDGGVAAGKKAHNLDAVWVQYVSNAVANTEDTVPHLLGRRPVAAWIGVPNKNAVIYAGSTAWTSTNIFMKASAATVTVNILVF